MEFGELPMALYENNCTMARENFSCELEWKRWNPDNRTADMNRELDFIKFKGEDMSKVCICRISELHQIGKTTDDIAWIATIPEQFKKFEMRSYI